MKRCPTCQRVYADEMGFCLEDGTALVSASGQPSSEAGATERIPASRLTNQSPTEVLPVGAVTQPSPQFAQQPYAAERNAPSRRKPSALPWILGAVILGLSGVIVGLVLMRGSGSNDSQVAQNTSQSANTTPTPESSNTVAMNPTGIPESANPPATETPGAMPVDRASAQASPTPKPTQTPRSTPAVTAPDEPRPQPTQTPAPERRAPVSGGVLNGRAISKPAPSYPAVARAARASGTVTVQVMIDETGKVVSARAVSGHPLLQQAAVQAAYGARFSPTLLSGQPVRVTGVITYNFVAP